MTVSETLNPSDDRNLYLLLFLVRSVKFVISVLKNGEHEGNFVISEDNRYCIMVNCIGVPTVLGNCEAMPSFQIITIASLYLYIHNNNIYKIK